MLVFDDAKYLCEQIPDCIGITRIDGVYELREGPKCLKDTQYISWTLVARDNFFEHLSADTEFQQCTMDNSIINEKRLIMRYKQIKSRRFCDLKTGEVRYLDPFTHLNDILKFKRKVDYSWVSNFFK